jgi:hypothetical protein
VENVAAQQVRERMRKLKETISNGLNVKMGADADP